MNDRKNPSRWTGSATSGDTAAMREPTLDAYDAQAFPVPRSRGRDRSATLMVWDAILPIVLITVTAPLEGSIGFRSQGGDAIGALHPAALILVFLSPVLVGAAGGYESHRDRFGGSVALYGRFVLIAALVVWIMWLSAAARGPEADLSQVVFFWALLPLGWLLPRLVGSSRFNGRPEHVVLVGSGHVARQVGELLRRRQSDRTQLLGYVDDEPMTSVSGGLPLLGDLDDLDRVLARGGVDRLIVCFSSRTDREIRHVILKAEEFGVDVDVVPRLFDLLPQEPRGGSLGAMPLINVRRLAPNVLERGLKRTLDVAFAAGLLALLSPIFLVVAVAIRLDDGGPVLYRSTRVGRRGVPFAMTKFRTLATGADRDEAQRVQALVAGVLKPYQAPSVTRVGGLLRKTSIDELPQLINVLKGRMSLVGPRPILPGEAHGVPAWQRSRHAVRPGMTGLWQVLGRGQLRWEERMHLDYSYSRHWSLAMDLRIMARTLPAIFLRMGAF